MIRKLAAGGLLVILFSIALTGCKPPRPPPVPGPVQPPPPPGTSLSR